MSTRKQVADLPIMTVVEHGLLRHGKWEKRWVVLNSRGGQSSITFYLLKDALHWAAWTTLSWELWVSDDNTFCR